MTDSPPSPSAATAAPGAWTPLRIPAYRALWTAALVSNVGTWMHEVAVAWLMTELAHSPLLVALVRTATSLPVFLLALPAGALGDVVDRRRLLLTTQAWMFAAAAALGAFALTGAVGPWGLLALTFALGVGVALNTPAWQAIVPELVPRHELAGAVALSGVSINASRAIGPAIGGALLTVVEPGVVFLLNAASFVGVLAVLYRWRRPQARSILPAERVVGAMVTGARYVRHAPDFKAVLWRTALFVPFASAPWALLPVVARDMGLESTGYGVLLGSLGVGAVAGAAVLPGLRRRFSIDHLLAGAAALFALSVAGVAFAATAWAGCLAMLAGGLAWITHISSLNVSAQRATASWVRARALSIFVLVLQGGMALGSFAWGAVAARFGADAALYAAAALLALAVPPGLRFRLAGVQDRDLAPSGHWPEPRTAPEAPAPHDGPVLVTVEYAVRPEAVPAFLEAMQALARVRRRDGAFEWSVYRDVAAPGRYVETFHVENWAEHLRQHARTTQADLAVEARVRACQREGVAVVVTHFVAARPA